MKKDFLKDFVDQNRSAFEYEMPDKDLMWQKISEESKPPKKIGFNYWKVATLAASVLVLALFTLLMVPSQSESNLSEDLQSEFVDIQNFYENQIEERSVALAAYDPNYLEVVQDFDDQYKQLVEDLEKSGNTDVLEEMIELYRAKLQVLEDLLDEIKEKEERHETAV